MILLGAPGDLPDEWSGVINALPAEISARPVANTGQPLELIEETLDKHELRNVDIVAYSGGAIVAGLFAARQPQRVGRLILVDPVVGLDERSIRAARTIFRFIPNFMFKRKGTTKKQTIEQMERASMELSKVQAKIITFGNSAQARKATEFFGAASAGNAVDYREEPEQFVALIQQGLSF